MSTTVRVRAIVQREHEVRLNAENILELLASQPGVVMVGKPRVYFDVPGGGDWSNTRIEIDDDYAVIVRWTESYEEGGEETIG